MWSWGSSSARGTFNFIQLENDGTNQQTAMTIDSSGNLSIGGATPQGNLTIKGAASDDIDLLTFSEDGTNQSFSFNGNFAGSGSTGKAAILEGFDFIGIELTEEYLPIIEGRLKHAEKVANEDKGLF